MKAVLLGATGLTGSHLLKLLIADDSVERITVLSRRAIEVNSPKVIVEILDFNDAAVFKEKIGFGDVIFCCIGTTLKKVKGNRQEYHKIDFDIPVNAARFGQVNAFSCYVLVSAIGANLYARNFYLRFKGEVEAAIEDLHFNSTYFFRPSILIGERHEKRIGETIGKTLATLFSFLFSGSWAKYRPVNAEVLAKAMLEAAKQKEPGVHRYTYQEMIELTGKTGSVATGGTPAGNKS